MTDISTIGSNGVSGVEHVSTIDSRPTTPTSQSPKGRPEPTDRVELSELAEFRAKLADLPAIRQDLVVRVRGEIAAGAYDSAERVESAVERLIEEEHAMLFE